MVVSIWTKQRRQPNSRRTIDCWMWWDLCGGGVVIAHCTVKHGRKYNNYLWIEYRICSKMIWQRDNSSSSTSKIKMLLDESTIVILLVNITSIAKKSHGGFRLERWSLRSAVGWWVSAVNGRILRVDILGGGQGPRTAVGAALVSLCKGHCSHTSVHRWTMRPYVKNGQTWKSVRPEVRKISRYHLNLESVVQQWRGIHRTPRSTRSICHQAENDHSTSIIGN